MNNADRALRKSAQLPRSVDGLEKLISQIADDGYVELRKSLPSRVQAISPFIAQLMRFLANFCNVDGRGLKMDMALQEALSNAVVHGNYEDPQKFVHVLCRCSMDGEISVTIRDQGRGFDIFAVPDPTAPDNLQREHGRGIFLMRTFMDEVSFSDGGSAVHMRKKSSISSVIQSEAQ